MSRLYDISPPVSEKIAVFPMDVPYTRDVSMHVDQGDHLTLSSIKTTLHVGAHADAPIHYHQDGETIDQRSLEIYMGSCQVIEVGLDRGEKISVTDIQNVSLQAPRILFKTNSFPDPNHWNDDFNSLSLEVVDYLAEHSVILTGIDTPSVDASDSQDLQAHQKIYAYDIAILEGLVLTEVKSGLYTLIALPLRLKEADASPVRAVLLEDIELIQ